jgi:hypothetical protein
VQTRAADQGREQVVGLAFADSFADSPARAPAMKECGHDHIRPSCSGVGPRQMSQLWTESYSRLQE